MAKGKAAQGAAARCKTGAQGADCGKEAEKEKFGREKARSIFKTPEDFTAAANKYFDECDATGRLYGEAGLCLALGKYNPSGNPVSLCTLHRWYDGESNPYLQEAVQQAYLRIQAQIEADPAYQERGMVTRGIFLQKQMRLGAYQDRVESKNETTVKIVHGDSVDMSDFQ